MQSTIPRIAVVGSGIGSMAFCYAFARHYRAPTKIYIVAGEERGLETNIPLSHGHLMATNYLGLGGTAMIWGGICKPYESILGGKLGVTVEDVELAATMFGVLHGTAEWRKECETVTPSSNATFSKVYFANADPLEDFWTRRYPGLSPHHDITIIRNTDCRAISEVGGKWKVDLTGPNTDTALRDVDIVVLAASAFHTPRILIRSNLIPAEADYQGVDHYMVTTGTIKRRDRIDYKDILPSNGSGKFAFAGQFEGHSYTIYLLPTVPKRMTSSKSQDRVIAISMLKRPLQYLKRARLIDFFHLNSFINVVSLVISYVFGARTLDILYIGEQKRMPASSGEPVRLLDEAPIFDRFQAFLSTQLDRLGEVTMLDQIAARNDARSAIHRTSGLAELHLTTDSLGKLQAPLVVADASDLDITSSYNPSFSIAVRAACYARTVATSLPEKTGLAESGGADNFNILVLGGNGYIGREVVVKLRNAIESGPLKGAHITVQIGRQPRKAKPQKVDNFSEVYFDLADTAQYRSLLDTVDIVIHCAHESLTQSTSRFLELIQFCRPAKLKRIVYLSTIATHELGHEIINEETPQDNKSTPYIRMKFCSELLLREIADDYRITCIALKPAIVVGDRPSQWISDVCSDALAGRVRLPKNGDGVCNLTHVVDIANAAIGLATIELSGYHNFVLRSGAPISWRQFYERAAQRNAFAVHFSRVGTRGTQRNENLAKFRRRLHIRGIIAKLALRASGKKTSKIIISILNMTSGFFFGPPIVGYKQSALDDLGRVDDAKLRTLMPELSNTVFEGH